jgi:hypothetical protein
MKKKKMEHEKNLNEIRINSENNINEINKNILKNNQEFEILSNNESNNYLKKKIKISHEKDEKIQEIQNSKQLQLLKQDLENQENEMILQMMIQQMMMQNQLNNKWNNQN